MKLTQTLLTILADGHFHSGPELGQMMGCTRSAVWKAIQSLQDDEGLEIYSVRGKGYRLSEPVELLDPDNILSNLSSAARSDLQKLDVFFDLDSTNAYLLLEAARHKDASGYVCLAEQQHSGRGRRGRTWVSPFGGNLYLSLLWQFSAGATQVAGLSLAMAVAVTRALREIGLEEVGVKWPNDIFVANCKLSGILLEVIGEASGPCSVVIGVGLNVRAFAAKMSDVEQPWTDLESALGRSVVRNEMASRLINHLMTAVREFEAKGLEPFLHEWQTHDIYAGQEVILHLPDGQTQGVARGVDNTGALLLAQGGEVRRFYSGEVSMRAAAG